MQKNIKNASLKRILRFRCFYLIRSSTQRIYSWLMDR